MRPVRFLVFSFLSCLQLSVPTCFALSKRSVDSLKAILRTNPADSQRAAILLDLSAQFTADSLISAFTYAHKAERLARQNNWNALRVRAELAIGACHDLVQQWPAAIARYRNARALAGKIGLDSLALQSEVLLSEAFNSAGSLDSTLHYKLIALDHARRKKNAFTEAQLLTYLGGYYKDLRQYPQALAYWHAALNATRNLQRPAAQAMALNNLADTYLELRQTDSAGAALREALALVRSNPTFSRTKSYVLASLGNYYIQAGKSQDAIRAAQAALALSMQPDGDRRVLEAVLELLSDYYKQLHQPDLALDYYKRYVVQRDSNRDESRKAEDARAVLKYNFELQAASNEAERLTLRQTSHLRLNALIASGIGLLIITVLAAYVFYALVLNKRKARTITSQAVLLRDQNDAIQESLREKEMLIREVHHRVKNNLQVISALLQLQGARSIDPLVRRSLEESQNRVLSIAFIHHNLYMHDDMQRVEMQSFLSELVEHLNSVYAAAEKNITVSLDLDPVSLEMDVAMPLGLIVNELLTNSYKYAFPSQEGGLIRIRLVSIDAGHCDLSYVDDGIGMYVPAGTGQVKTLGLTLVNDLCRQLGGRPAITGDDGFQFRLRFRCIPDEDDN